MASLLQNEAQDVVVVGAKGGCIHAISLFVPSSDLTPAWQRLLKSRSESEEESNDEGCYLKFKFFVFFTPLTGSTLQRVQVL